MAPPILTVSELNRLARSAIEQRLPLLWVTGEVSNLTRAPSGHVYFSLKDAAAQVRCVMFRNRAQSLPWRVENGHQVEAQVLASLYEPRGDFQLNVEALRRAGLGKLYEAFVQLRERLAGQGLFDATRKRTLPRFPRCIGIVTSPKAAALQDVLAALARRAPHVPVVLYPTLVQGEGAAPQIAAALSAAGARAECDVLIVCRGGGSLEDLWAFNDEALAHALRACPIPVVAGIGHETDVTIAEMAADVRAATPTAAAELATAGWHVAAEEIESLTLSMRQAMRRRLERRMQSLDVLAHRLVHPAQRLARLGQRLDLLGARLRAAAQRLAQRSAARLSALQLRLAHCRPAAEPAARRLAHLESGLRHAMTARLGAHRIRLENLGASIRALSPEATLARGYSIVRCADGSVVRDGSALNKDDRLSLRFAKGGAEAVVITKVPD